MNPEILLDGKPLTRIDDFHFPGESSEEYREWARVDSAMRSFSFQVRMTTQQKKKLFELLTGIKYQFPWMKKSTRFRTGIKPKHGRTRKKQRLTRLQRRQKRQK